MELLKVTDKLKTLEAEKGKRKHIAPTATKVIMIIDDLCQE